MSHLLNEDFQIHHIDQMHHIGLVDHVGLMGQILHIELMRYLVF